MGSTVEGIARMRGGEEGDGVGKYIESGYAT